MDWLFSLQGYPLVFIATFLEGTAIPFPGAFLLAWSGFIIGRDISVLITTIIIGTCAYLAGSLIPYFLGYHGGRPMVERFLGYLKIPVYKIDLAQNWFNRHGLWIIGASRPFFLGNYISFIAGIARTNLFVFFLWTCLGILPWVTAYLFLGAIFGKYWPAALELATQYSFAAAVLIFIVGGIYLSKNYLLKLLYKKDQG